MSLSEELRGFAEQSSEHGDIPPHVLQDLLAYANEVACVERERDERRVMTAEEHARVVRVYIDLLSERCAENARLRELCASLWHDARLMDANMHIEGMRLTDMQRDEYLKAFDELGIVGQECTTYAYEGGYEEDDE